MARSTFSTLFLVAMAASSAMATSISQQDVLSQLTSSNAAAYLDLLAAANLSLDKLAGLTCFVPTAQAYLNAGVSVSAIISDCKSTVVEVAAAAQAQAAALILTNCVDDALKVPQTALGFLGDTKQALVTVVDKKVSAVKTEAARITCEITYKLSGVVNYTLLSLTNFIANLLFTTKQTTIKVTNCVLNIVWYKVSETGAKLSQVTATNVRAVKELVVATANTNAVVLVVVDTTVNASLLNITVLVQVCLSVFLGL